MGSTAASLQRHLCHSEFNTLFTSQIPLTEMTFPLCHLVTARVFLCRVLETHLMQEVSYTSDKVLSQKGLISCLIYAGPVNNSATRFASCCSTTVCITDTAKPRHDRG